DGEVANHGRAGWDRAWSGGGAEPARSSGARKPWTEERASCRMRAPFLRFSGAKLPDTARSYGAFADPAAQRGSGQSLAATVSGPCAERRRSNGPPPCAEPCIDVPPLSDSTMVMPKELRHRPRSHAASTEKALARGRW